MFRAYLPKGIMRSLSPFPRQIICLDLRFILLILSSHNSETLKPQLYNNSTIIWKDWTTVGVDIAPYHGEDIKIRLTTYDCKDG
jgi:hypothetical protein